MDRTEALQVNRMFHDHECAYYDERFAIGHDGRAARMARSEVQRLLGRALRPAEVVLDPGCGTGWQAAGLRRATAGLAVVGLDLSAGMLDRARAAGAWPLVHGDAGRLPFAGATFDLVVTRGVLHHLADVTGALAEWRRVLRPGGAVVIAAEPTPAAERHAAALVRVLLPLLRRPLTAEEDVWEVAAMAANLHVFTPADLGRMAREAGYPRVSLSARGFAGTLVLAVSYVMHGRRPGLAARLPWRALAAGAGRLDAVLADRLLPERLRHTVVGVLRT